MTSAVLRLLYGMRLPMVSRASSEPPLSAAHCGATVGARHPPADGRIVSTHSTTIPSSPLSRAVVRTCEEVIACITVYSIATRGPARRAILSIPSTPTTELPASTRIEEGERGGKECRRLLATRQSVSPAGVVVGRRTPIPLTSDERERLAKWVCPGKPPTGGDD
jgi:hypothetical protein